MTINPETTLGQLQIELAKFGIDSLVWSALGAHNGDHAITFVTDERRVVGYGTDMISALNDALNKFHDEVGADIIIERAQCSK